jgi:hypothetical protein
MLFSVKRLKPLIFISLLLRTRKKGYLPTTFLLSLTKLVERVVARQLRSHLETTGHYMHYMHYIVHPQLVNELHKVCFLCVFIRLYKVSIDLFNQLQPQYKTIIETGPAHQKKIDCEF